MVCQKYFLVSIIIVITIVIISIHFFVYLFIPLIFLVQCQETCFKNSSYVFSKSGTRWNFNWYVCWYQGGYLVSIETEEEWQFISHEIQKRIAWNTSAWHIGLGKRAGIWTWESGQQLNILKWRDSEPRGNDNCAPRPNFL